MCGNKLFRTVTYFYVCSLYTGILTKLQYHMIYYKHFNKVLTETVVKKNLSFHFQWRARARAPTIDTHSPAGILFSA